MSLGQSIQIFSFIPFTHSLIYSFTSNQYYKLVKEFYQPCHLLNRIFHKLAPTPSKTTPEQRYWRSYITPQLIKENHPITSIEFNPTTPNDFAIASATKIQVFI